MADDWISRNRPGAFQHPSFGKRDGWFVVIQLTSLACALTSALALLPPLSVGGEGVGGGLSRASAVGILIYGVWIYGLMSFRRWAIAGLPAVSWLLLAIGLLVCAAPAILPAPIMPGERSAFGWFASATGFVSACLAVIALWRMRGREFREYHASAIARR